jgi:hypothetical protein
MPDDTTQKQLADLSKKLDKVLRNQVSLDGLLHIIGEKIDRENAGQINAFKTLAKDWKVEG